MGKDTPQSTSSSNRYSNNGSNMVNNNNNNNNNNNGSISSNHTQHDNNIHSSSVSNNNSITNNKIHSDSILPLHTSTSERVRTPDLEASYGHSSSSTTSRSRKSKTPSPPLSPGGGGRNSGGMTNSLLGNNANNPSFPSSLPRRWTKKPCLMIGLGLGLLLPIWIFTTGVITLDSFNDVVRYLPGYSIFANNLLYLVMLLLFISFTALAVLPILPMYLLGLPFHLLIFSIFNKLMSDWLWWITCVYTVLFLAPHGTWILARARKYQQERNGRRKDVLIRHNKPVSSSTGVGQSGSPTPSFVKYSPLSNSDNSGVDNMNNNDLSSKELDGPTFHRTAGVGQQSTFSAIGQRLEYGVQLLSKTNPRTSVRWRTLLAWALLLSYVIPVTMRNESRIFDPKRASTSFDIDHPGHLCSPQAMDGALPARHQDFEGYWREYLDFHHKMVIPERQGGIPDKDKKFLIFQPSDDGLGNRLQALLSSVVLAMVSKRAIILDWVAMPQCNANFTDLFEQPKDLAWDLNTTLPFHKDDPIFKKKPEIWYPYCRNCALRSAITPDSTWSNLLCQENLFGAKDASKKFIQIFSTQWFLPVIQNNPYYRQELCQIFPDGGSNAFEILAKKLLKPSREVQQKIDSVMERIPRDTTLIGLQVRRTENNAVGQGIEDSFLSCAQRVVAEEDQKPSGFGSRSRSGLGSRAYGGNDEITPYGSDNDRSVVQEGHRPLRASLGGVGGGSGSGSFTKKYAFYLATDYRPTRAHFQDVLGDQLFVLENTFESHKATVASPASPGRHAMVDDMDEEIVDDSSASHASDPEDLNLLHNVDPTSDEFAALPNSSDSSHSQSEGGAGAHSETEAVVRNSIRGVQTAVAEMFLLAQADRIISSPYSTFGYFAHGYANVQPNIVKRDGTCTFRKSTQPCFQYWFGFANGGAQCSIKSTIEMSEDYDCWL